jgi:hypothetical protein
MPIRHPLRATAIRQALLWLLAVLCLSVAAQQEPLLAGNWVLNAGLSDNTDRQVEAALRAAGQKVQRRLFDRTEDRYRGGPADQELYDRISYDKVLRIDLSGDVYQFTYADDYLRPVYTDDRRRSVSLTQLDQVEDFSLGHWENAKLLVEARPRDGGYAEETYALINNGTQLRVDLFIMPRTFTHPIELTRIYDRRAAP